LHSADCVNINILAETNFRNNNVNIIKVNIILYMFWI